MAKLNYEPLKKISDQDGRCNLTREILVIDQMLYNCQANAVDADFLGYQVSVFYFSGYGFYNGGQTMILVPDSENTDKF